MKLEESLPDGFWGVKTLPVSNRNMALCYSIRVFIITTFILVVPIFIGQNFKLYTLTVMNKILVLY